MKIVVKDSRIELIPEGEMDQNTLAEIPEGTNKAFVYTTLDGGADGTQEALVIYLGDIPSLDEKPKEDP